MLVTETRAPCVSRFRDDQQHGHGMLTWPDGRRYQGQWAAGERHGEGLVRAGPVSGHLG